MGLPASPENQQLTIEAIRRAIPPIAGRPLKVYANFHLNMDTFLRSPEAMKRRPARLEALRKLRDKDYTYFEPRQRPRHADVDTPSRILVRAVAARERARLLRAHGKR